jgi:hypothetical protein
VNLSPDRDENDGPLPSSRYPKTLLAIVTAAVSLCINSFLLLNTSLGKVERALELTINNNYDYTSSKLIPKPDPTHPTQKLTTSMFAFSEAIWEPRVEFYLEKSVVKLKDKEWDAIMDAASEYSPVIKAKQAPLKGKARSHVQATEEEHELEYDSNSEPDQIA